MIQLRNLQKFFNKGRQNEIHVINDVTLELPDSGLVAVFGPSGCGKTTLLNVISGMDSVDSGEILLNDGEMEKKNREFDVLRNRDIGVIFQNYNLNRKETVFDNVADSLRLCGMDDESVIEERVMAALTIVGMEKFRKRQPDMLSGGQQQRVAIARAIVKNPKVILADEPTGNLDEANTIMVMDLLKAMSKECLVLLVTHEAQLVDYYCDTVIELKDGCVANVRSNEDAGGYVARNKNDIYLGELPEQEMSDGNTDLTFFGDKPEEPIKITVVNQNGRLFLKINTPRVTLLDEGSEVKLKEGVYQETVVRRENDEKVDMSKLPPFEGKEYGKLFRLRSTIRKGYTDNFKSMMQKKSKKRLAICLALFGAAFVFIAAMFGQGIGKVINAKKQYNDKVLYVAAMTDDVAPVLEKLANDPSAAIDYWGLGSVIDHYPTDPKIKFSLARFVSDGYTDEGLRKVTYLEVPMTVFPETMIGKSKVLAGRATPIMDNEIVISKRVAKNMIEQSPYPYIDDYDIILGLLATSPEAGINKMLSVVGIVDTDEVAAYVSDITLAEMRASVRGYGQDITYDCDGYFGVAKGECTIIIGGTYSNPADFGMSGDIIYHPSYVYPENYDQYENDPDKEYNGATPVMPRAGDMVYYNGVELKVKEVKTLLEGNHNPTLEEITEAFQEVDAHLPVVDMAYMDVSGEIVYNKYPFVKAKNFAVVLNREDYIRGSQIIGKTTRMLDMRQVFMGKNKETQPGIYEDGQSMFHYQTNQPKLYYIIHSTDPKVTSKRLEEEFVNLEAPFGNQYNSGDPEFVSYHAIYTATDRFHAHTINDRKTMLKLVAVGGILLAFLCLCMYFIMKSNIINRIREVGIYRAIGVTKKNMKFRFIVETGVVVTLSVMVGYLIASFVVRYILSAGTFADSLFYYPLWLAAGVLVVLYVVCIFCGIIPVIRVLRRTPAEILSKYDI